MADGRQRIRSAIEESDGTALVAFMTAGFPDPGGFAADLRAVAEVADVVEIGVPFSDPMADGVTVQRASQIAIENGVSLTWILAELESPGFELGAPVVLMSYLNPLLAFGFEALAARAAEVGVDGLIVPDLPLEESGPLDHELRSHGLALIQLVTPATPVHRLAELARASSGFVYAVTRTGTTGSGGLAPDLEEYLKLVKQSSELPVCAGFGVRHRAQVETIGRHADGVIVGSALVEALERGEDGAAFLGSLRS